MELCQAGMGWRCRARTKLKQRPAAQPVRALRRNGLVAGLGELQAAREAVAVDVPVELLQYVDGGGNPDAFTADVFRRANRGNQLAKGRAQALAGFRCALRLGCHGRVWQRRCAAPTLRILELRS